MVDINWNILRPVDIGGAFQQGMEQGRQRRAESEIDKQLAAMAQNPNAPISNELMKFAPRQAYALQQQRAEQAKAEEQRQIRMQAAQGNPAAMVQLSGINLDEFRALRGDQREAAKQGIDTIGQLALMADNPQKWDSIVGQLAQTDPAFRQYIGRFDMRDAIIAQAGQAKALLEQQEPKYQVIPEGGTLVNTRDPAALQQVANQNAPANMGDLQAQAEAAIKAGADPAKVRARLQELGGAASNGGGNFPGWY